jgi:dienelactone hydrolase
VDQDVRIHLRGFSPGQTVLVRASTQDDDNRRWTSHAQYRVDASGCVDLATAKSIGGSYRGVSPMGLFWSMRLDQKHANGRVTFAKNSMLPNCVAFEAEAAGQVVASAAFTRAFLPPGTEVRCLQAGNVEGVVQASDSGDDSAPMLGKLFIPPGTGPHPVVVVLSGSGGGFDLDKAAVLSRHGFATLALAYFGIPPLPTWLHRIPLEYFAAALGWLVAQPEIDAERVGVLGVSRGAELALLLGGKFPQVRAVVAYSPSSVVWAAGGHDKITGEIIPSWTWRGQPVSFAPLPLRGFMWRSAVPVVALRRPVMFRNLFRAGLRNREAVEQASIPVEQIRGPILLISGGDDHLWPAAEMSEAIVARLKRHAFTHSAEHLHYPRAGHMLRYPHLPTTSRQSRNPHLRNAKYSFGGTAPADADAQADSWPRAIAFFQSNL